VSAVVSGTAKQHSHSRIPLASAHRQCICGKPEANVRGIIAQTHAARKMPTAEVIAECTEFENRQSNTFDAATFGRVTHPLDFFRRSGLAGER